MSYFIEKVTFEIIEDDYVKGEISNPINNWTENPKENFATLNGALDYILIKNHYNPTKWTRDDINAKGEFWNSILINKDELEATEEEIEKWKKGEIKLYSLNINAVIIKIEPLEEGEDYV